MAKRRIDNYSEALECETEFVGSVVDSGDGLELMGQAGQKFSGSRND